MRCDQVAPVLDAHMDGDLEDGRAEAIGRHISDCPACRAKLDRRLALRSELRALGRFAAPPELDRRIRRVVQAATMRPRASFAWRSFGLGLGAGAAAMVAGIAAFLVLGPSRHAGVVDFVSAHLRALPAPDATRIASNDPHSIRPWLAGRTDLSPRVTDLADAGYPLLGARVDYVDGRPAVALVYGRRKHLINLFAQAAEGAPNLPATAARRGHAVVSWRDGDFFYVAVSDLSVEELENFARLVRGMTGKPVF